MEPIVLYLSRPKRGEARIVRQSKTLFAGARYFLRTAARADSAAELLEVAFVLPVLLSLIIGMVSFARAYNAYQTITRAAREGARTLVLTNCATCGNAEFPAASARTIVNNVLVSASFSPSAVTNYSATYVWTDSGAATPQQCGVAIKFTYPFQLVIPFTSVNLTNLQLNTSAQMRLENQPATCPVGNSVP
jgi:Flp pilus assembly protein TadG